MSTNLAGRTEGSVVAFEPSSEKERAGREAQMTRKTMRSCDTGSNGEADRLGEEVAP